MANSTKECLAIIPARGGSKGIPRKNLRMIAGRPLVAWTIDAALNAQHVTRTVVSTDDAEIASVARSFGAEVVARPAEISGDTASSESALLYTLSQLEREENYRPDLLAFLQCTSPLIESGDIDGAVEALLRDTADSALSVCRFNHFAWKQTDDGSAIGINHDKSFRPRRQDREPQYLETGAVYVMRTEGFKIAKHRFFGKTTMHEMPGARAMEIDEPHELVVAESLLRARMRLATRQQLPKPVGAVVFDFDGVFTDNGVWLDQEGREAVVCRRDDGMGISLLRRLDIPILVLSTEANPVVAARCRKLQIECVQACTDKLSTLTRWAERRNIDRSKLVYAGNDLNDVECLAWAGCGVAVADAYPAAHQAARVVLSRAGGQGAVRELCDLILENASEWISVAERKSA